LLGCYVDVVKNMNDEICVNTVLNGQPLLLKVKQLFGKVGKLTCILRSGVIKKVNEELFWSLNVAEIKVDDISPDQYIYFKQVVNIQHLYTSIYFNLSQYVLGEKKFNTISDTIEHKMYKSKLLIL